MRYLPLLSWIAACSAPLDAELSAVEAAPTPPAEFSLSGGNFVAGEAVQLSVSGATPGASLRVLFSVSGLGAGPCLARLGGECADILGPITALPASAIADASGSATISLVVPAFAAGRTASLQAVAVAAQSALSNPISRLVGPLGAVIDPAIDADLDGFTPAQGDCADFDATIRPGAVDLPGDGLDLNCDDADGVDLDGDGVAGLGGADCDDTDATVFPSAVDTCDGRDEDCDGVIDAGRFGGACGRSEIQPAGLRPADLLLVVDNSASMFEEQARLAAVAAPMVAALSDGGLDLHVGVVTTDTDVAPGELVEVNGQRWIDAALHPDPELWTDQAIQVGISGSPVERGIDASARALSPALALGVNFGFLRGDADLHVLFVSDEQDSSSLSTNGWLGAVGGLKTWPFAAEAHGLIGPAAGCATAESGDAVRTLVQATNGLEGSICASSYAPLFFELAERLLPAGGGQQITLGAPADPSTLAVEVDIPGVGVQAVAAGDYTYDAASRALTVLSPQLPPGSSIRVAYDL
jgi:hypothetical protein